MRKMKNPQIDKLNELLMDNSETLTAFYDEAIDIGIRKGFIVGVTVSLVSGIGMYGVIKLKSKIKNTENKE